MQFFFHDIKHTLIYIYIKQISFLIFEYSFGPVFQILICYGITSLTQRKRVLLLNFCWVMQYPPPLPNDMSQTAL